MLTIAFLPPSSTTPMSGIILPTLMESHTQFDPDTNLFLWRA